MRPFVNEPHADFSRETVRRGLAEAIARAHRGAPRRCPLLIDGEWVETRDRIRSINPSATDEVIGDASSADASHVEAAVQAAVRAFPAWAATPVPRRAEILLRAAEGLRRRRTEICAWMVLEEAKPWREADADVCEAIDFCEYYAREMLVLGEPIRLQPDVPGEVNELGYAPVGVAVVIAPWNFPLAIPTGMATAAFVAGNCVLLKPAKQSPVMGQFLAEALVEAGAPRGTFQLLHGVGQTLGPLLVSRPEVGVIAFTGSRAVGLDILSRASVIQPDQRHIRRTVLELGGKNAIIVDTTADPDAAIPDIIHSAFGYAGQKCSACSRLIVLDAIHDRLLPRLRAAAASLVVGPAEDPATQVPALIEASAAERLRRAIDLARREGELIHLADIGDLPRRGHFVPPAIVGGVGPDHVLAQEELFGPLLTVLRVQTFDEAIAVANGTTYALTGGVHSRTPAHLEQARREFLAGNLYFNRSITGAVVGRQPFGGFKLSGVGSKAGGPDYLKQFMLARTWSENTMRHGFAPLDDTESKPPSSPETAP